MIGVPVAYGLETFKNRSHELEYLSRVFTRPDTRVVTIVGRRGIGKSALAAKAAELFASGSVEFRPLGIVNVSSRTSGISFERVFMDSARLLDRPDEDRLNQVWMSSRSVSDKALDLFAALVPLSCLVIIDNLEDLLTDQGDIPDEELRLLFDLVFRAPAPPRLLITSQVPPMFASEVRRYEARLRLDSGLPVAEGIDLLRDLDRSADALADTTDAELARTVIRVHGIPRALELVVAAISDDYLTTPTLTELLETYAARGDIVAGLSQERYHRLDEQARLVMDVLAVFQRPTTIDSVVWVLGPLAPAVDVAPAMATLARTQMVTLDRRMKTFAVHPLDADLVYAKLPASGAIGLRALERRVAQWYLRNAPPEQEWRVADDVLLYRWAFVHSLKAQDFEPAAHLLEAIGEFLVWQGSSAAVLDMHEQLDGRLVNDDVVLGHLLGFGFARTIGGPIAEAIPLLERAEALARAQSDDRKVEHVLRMLAAAYRPAGRLDEGITAAARAADIAHELGLYHNESHSLVNLSLCHSYRGDVAAALDAAERMFQLGLAENDDLVLARAYDAKSAAYLVAEQWQEAGDNAAAAIEAYQRSGVPEAIGYTRNAQGLSWLGLGDLARAKEAFLLGLEDGSTAGQPRVEGFCRYNLAWVYWMARSYPAAAEQALLSQLAFDRAASAEANAAAAFAQAAVAMLNQDHPASAAGLRRAAEYSQTNPDLCPATWLTNAAAELIEKTAAIDEAKER